MVGLTALRNSTRDVSYSGIGICIGRTPNCGAGTIVAAEKTREGDHRLVPYFGVRLCTKHPHEIRYDVGDRQIAGPAPLAGDAMQRAFTNERHRIAQRSAESFGRGVAGVMIQQEQARAPHRRVRVAERCGLHGSNGHDLAKPRASVLRQRAPSTDEVDCHFESARVIGDLRRA